MRIESERNRIAEKLPLDKHVVAAGLFTKDAGSTPAASTTLKIKIFTNQLKVPSL